VSPAKVTLVYPGVDKQFKPIDREAARQLIAEQYGIRAPFVLTVGVIQPRKNLPRLMEAFAKLKGNWQSEHELVIVGKRGWMESGLERRIQRLGLTGHVILTGYVPYERLPAFYSAAEAFVYPSVYEGFGLPPLEAMACGTPVITGDRSSLPEVVGEAGIMVDPYDVDAFIEAMSNVLSSESLKAEMTAQGLKQAGKFSWDEMARQVSVIYREVGK
jgi:glycosyltransferase involved in cell wall biosynthesis